MGLLPPDNQVNRRQHEVQAHFNPLSSIEFLLMLAVHLVREYNRSLVLLGAKCTCRSEALPADRLTMGTDAECIGLYQCQFAASRQTFRRGHGHHVRGASQLTPTRPS